MAAKWGKANMVALLLDKGANLEAKIGTLKAHRLPKLMKSLGFLMFFYTHDPFGTTQNRKKYSDFLKSVSQKSGGH